MDALTFLSAHVPLFAGISEEALSPLAVAASLKKLAPGQPVLFAGMTVEALHIVAMGKVVVQAKIPNKGLVKLAELTSGETFGEASILEGNVAGATVKAGEEGALVMAVAEEPFRRLVSENPEFAARVRALILARRASPPPAVAA